MSPNPISRARLIGSAAIVVVTVFALVGARLSLGPSGLVWAYIIGGVAISYVVVSFVLHWRNPVAADAAWDEQNTHAYRNSLIFGYWAVLWVFVGMLLVSLTGQLDPGSAFFWMGPVLGAVPPAHYLVSIMRGRAE